MANTVNVSALTDYVEVRKDELFVKAAAGAKSLDYVEIMGNVKYKEQLNYLDSEVVLQEASCDWNPQGSDTFAERYIEVHPVEVEKEYCYLDFRKKYMNYQLNLAAGRETLPFEQKLAESNLNAIQEAVEDLVWQGSSGLSIDGWIAQASADTANTVSVTWASGSTTIAKIDAVVAAIPIAALKKGVNIFLSYTDFRSYIAEQNASCCANRPIVDANVDKLSYVGDSRISIVPVLGLEGTDVIFAAPADALVYGTDIEDSETMYRFWFNEDEQKFKFRVLFNAGTAIKFPDQVVLGTVA